MPSVLLELEEYREVEPAIEGGVLVVEERMVEAVVREE